MKWAMMVLRMSGMSWTPFFTSNRRSKSTLNSRPIALTLSAHAIETNDGSCLTLIHRQTILNHLAIVIASRDQLFVACIAEVFLFGSQGRQVISAPNDTGDVVRTVALGTHAATHQLLDQRSRGRWNCNTRSIGKESSIAFDWTKERGKPSRITPDLYSGCWMIFWITGRTISSGTSWPLFTYGYNIAQRGRVATSTCFPKGVFWAISFFI